MYGRTPERLHPEVREFWSTHVCCRSGLFHYPHEVPGHVYGSLSTPIAIDALIEEFEDFPLKFEPGTQLGYSNAGYSMLAKVIEEVSETSFDDYLQTNIFTPTRMNQTAADWIRPPRILRSDTRKSSFGAQPTTHPTSFEPRQPTPRLMTCIGGIRRSMSPVQYVNSYLGEEMVAGWITERCAKKAYGLPIAGCSPWMSCRNSGTVSWK